MRFFYALQDKHSLLKEFYRPEDLLSLFHTEGNLQKKTNILRVLIHEYQNNPDAKKLASLFLALFRPALKIIFKTFMRKSKDLVLFEPLDLWLEIRQCFMEALYECNLSKHTPKQAQRIVWRTRYRLKRWWKTQIREEKIKGVTHELPSREFPSEKVKDVLESLCELNVINAREKDILRHTLLQGKSLKDYAKENPSLTYENIRKIKSRAEEKIKKFAAKNPRFLDI